MKVFLYSAMKVFLYCNEGILSIIKGLQLRYSHIHTYIHKNTERMPPKFRAQALPEVGGHREQKKTYRAAASEIPREGASGSRGAPRTRGLRPYGSPADGWPIESSSGC